MSFVKVAKVSELSSGQGKIVEVDGVEVALFNVNGEFFATSNTCPHRGGPLGEGELEGEVVTCPWHGWSFSVKTGISPVMPTAKVQTYKVKVENDEVFVSVE